MTIRQFMSIMTLGTLTCWAAWGIILWNVDPFEASMLSLVFFYCTLFFSLSGTISTILYTIYHFWGNIEIPIIHYVHRSMTYGLISAGLFVSLVLMSAYGFLNIWSGTIGILAIAFAISLKRSKKSEYTYSV